MVLVLVGTFWPCRGDTICAAAGASRQQATAAATTAAAGLITPLPRRVLCRSPPMMRLPSGYSGRGGRPATGRAFGPVWGLANCCDTDHRACCMRSKPAGAT